MSSPVGLHATDLSLNALRTPLDPTSDRRHNFTFRLIA
jgi:hypothetical protein